MMIILTPNSVITYRDTHTHTHKAFIHSQLNKRDLTCDGTPPEKEEKNKILVILIYEYFYIYV